MSDRYYNPVRRNIHLQNPKAVNKTNGNWRPSNRVISNDSNSNQLNRRSTRGGFNNNNSDRGGRSEFNRNCESNERRRLEDPRWANTAKKVIAKRFNYDSLYLNLGELSNDPDLTTSHVPMIISSQFDVGAIFKVILTITSELKILNLGGNNISNLGPISHFLRKFRGITKLNLADNNIQNLGQVRKLSYLKLDELIMRDNPVVDMLKDDYVRDVRHVFPTLKILDNATLSPEQNHVALDTLTLPTPKMICCRNMPFAEIAGKFINQYFAFIDAGNIGVLGEAYHPDAILTMSVNTYRCKGLIPSGYVSNSRNMKFYSPNDDRKDRVTFHGRNEIVELLKKLPLSKHTAVTFDMNVEESSYAIFTVTGNVHDVKNDYSYLFIRTYCVVPNMQNNGFFIINEQITVCKSPHKEVTANIIPPASAVPSLPPSLSALTTPELNTVTEFSRMTGMILSFAHECLVGNKWDVSRAMSDFNNLKASNRIPVEAYIP